MDQWIWQNDDFYQKTLDEKTTLMPISDNLANTSGSWRTAIEISFKKMLPYVDEKIMYPVSKRFGKVGLLLFHYKCLKQQQLQNQFDNISGKENKIKIEYQVDAKNASNKIEILQAQNLLRGEMSADYSFFNDL